MTDAFTELDSLKEMANTLGIKYSNNISVETLKQKIEEARNTSTKDSKPSDNSKIDANKIRQENLALKRVKITCLDPSKKDLKGEFITVANNYIGNITKFIPYNCKAADAWHVPYCIYKKLKNMKYTDRYTEIDPVTKREVVKDRLNSAFHLEDLPPLTEQQLKELAKLQEINRSFSDED